MRGDSGASPAWPDAPAFELRGGRSTPGVVRVGDTVRRPAGAHSARTQALLRHLEAAGFERVPRYLGQDGQGRDVLSWLAGDVPAALGHHADEILAAAAALLRRFHDATAPLASLWCSAAEVVCHADWGPANTVFREGRPWGLIDFDTAAPGARSSDLGHAAFFWLDLGNDDYAAHEQARRLSLFVRAYDHAACPVAVVAEAVVVRQEALARRGARQGRVALAHWAADAAAWTRDRLMPALAGRDGSV